MGYPIRLSGRFLPFKFHLQVWILLDSKTPIAKTTCFNMVFKSLCLLRSLSFLWPCCKVCPTRNRRRTSLESESARFNYELKESICKQLQPSSCSLFCAFFRFCDQNGSSPIKGSAFLAAVLTPLQIRPMTSFPNCKQDVPSNCICL